MQKITISILLVLFLVAAASAQQVGSAYIFAPAVLTSLDVGTLTTISLNVTYGNGNVAVVGPSSVGSSTIDSAITAAGYAAHYLGMNQSDYNFTYAINDRNVSVSGPSAGLAFTVLAVSALSGSPLVHDFTLTGTISNNGTVGLIGGAYDKVGIAKAKGLKFVLVPYATNSSFEKFLYYIVQQKFGIPIAMVSNVTQALPYVYGYATPVPVTYNLSANYNLADLPSANLSCSNSCNITAFSDLTNFTLNFTTAAIYNISGNYSAIKGEILNEMKTYRAIAAKGYLYSAADLSFLTFANAFLLENMNYTNATSAGNLISSVSNYCSAQVPPQLTSTNYEYVIGGELRQALGNATAQSAEQMLKSAQTTDGIVESIYELGPAYGWCQASNEMYNIASTMGGNPVEVSPTLKSTAMRYIDAAEAYGPSNYLAVAVEKYNSGDYATALYAAVYALVLDNATIAKNYTTSQMYSIAEGNIRNSTFGIWPTEFALQSQFYLDEGSLAPVSANSSMISEGYVTSFLAKQLDLANRQIVNSFVNVSVQNQALQSQLSAIQQQISLLYYILVVILALLIVILVMLLVVALGGKPASKRRIR